MNTDTPKGTRLRNPGERALGGHTKEHAFLAKFTMGKLFPRENTVKVENYLSIEIN